MKRWSIVSVVALAASAQAAQPNVGGGGLGAYLWVCMLGGLASLLTPCVFPMIPVTISYFTKRTGSRAVALAIAYSLGIVSTFAVIGVATAVLFGATGVSNFAANPWVNLGLGVLFVVLALNLFGLYEFHVPYALTNRTASASRKEGLAGPFFMGATFSLTSFTCTAPIVATVLASAAGGRLGYAVVGMATYGTAFAAPFFLLALFPSRLSRLPKSGEWLSVVKPTLAFIEIAAAIKFFSNADLGLSAGWLTRPVFLGVWAVVFGMMGAFLLGLPERMATVGWGRRTLGVLTFALTGYLLSGLHGSSLGEINSFLPPDPYPTTVAAKTANVTPNEAIVASDYQDALAKAQGTHRPIFIDFTGVTCTNCRYMEQNIFPDAGVQREFKKFVKVQLYTDRQTDSDRANQALQMKLANDNALPTYVLLTPEGKVIDVFQGATRNAGEFAQFLEKAPSKA